MANLLSATAKSLGAFINLALVMCIVLYMFAVTGMQLFGDSYTTSIFGSDIPRWNFVDFGHSFMLIFRVVCGEWIEPLWDCMRASHPGAVLLFISAFIMGNFVVSIRYLNSIKTNRFSTSAIPCFCESSTLFFVIFFQVLCRLLLERTWVKLSMLV